MGNDWNATKSIAKAKRRGVAEQRERKGHSKRTKNFSVVATLKPEHKEKTQFFFGESWTVGKYHAETDAKKALDYYRRSESRFYKQYDYRLLDLRTK